MRIRKAIGSAVAAVASALSGAAWGAAPAPWQMNLQPPVTPAAERMLEFHNLLFVITTAIAVFVLVLLLWTVWKFSAKRNPVPTKTTHNTLLEMAWTVVPVIILVVIAVPSFKLLYYTDTVPKADLTVKAIGHQWYWSYEYPDHGKIAFDATMVQPANLKPGQPRLLETDNAVVVPVGTTVRVIVTATDVLHAWAVPAFGVKVDAVPGRLNETWFQATKEGTYYGQCSELCGTNHGFMPIKIEVVAKDKFNGWVNSKKTAMERGAPSRPVVALAHPAR